MDFFDRASRQLITLFRVMTPAARATAALMTVLVVVGLVFLCARPGAAPEVDLMRGVPLAPSRLPAMEAALAKAGLAAYEVRGTSIFVPRGKEAAYMAALANADVLPPNFGQVLEKAVSDGGPFLGRRDREERIKIATQAELSLLIRSMSGIENAYVIYDEDAKRGFNKDKLITAIAGVKPIGDARLDAARVLDIQHMLAGAIAGLEPENVTVADLNGRVWHGKLKGTTESGRRPAPAPLTDQTAENSTDAKTPMFDKTAAERGDESPPGFQWPRQPWSTLGLFALGLLGVLALRSFVRGANRTAAKENRVEEGPARTAGSAAPPPHWERADRTIGQSHRDELSQLVDEDPETAANILRNWIGQAN
ncbi:MAG: hypothetical protein JW959_13345 [Pirellulales bacterium]|nr:hypothetical protein [Pirellulales bacterium]